MSCNRCLTKLLSTFTRTIHTNCTQKTSENNSGQLYPEFEKDPEGELSITNCKQNFLILHKSTLAVTSKKYMLSGSTCICNLTKP